MSFFLHTYDLPDDVSFSGSVAMDTEAMGLRHHRDRLCLVQLSAGDGVAHLVHFPEPRFDRSPNLRALLTDGTLQKIFHFARFDVAILNHSFNLVMKNIFCTKIASKLTRTYTGKHGLKELCRDFIGIELNKQEQTSDWGASVLTQEQLSYAANDVYHLHTLKEKLEALLARENRMALAQACFDFLPYRAVLDLQAGENFDIFNYASD